VAVPRGEFVHPTGTNYDIQIPERQQHLVCALTSSGPPRSSRPCAERRLALKFVLPVVVVPGPDRATHGPRVLPQLAFLWARSSRLRGSVASGR
jgi:hypothetical protein